MNDDDDEWQIPTRIANSGIRRECNNKGEWINIAADLQFEPDESELEGIMLL